MMKHVAGAITVALALSVVGAGSAMAAGGGDAQPRLHQHQGVDRRPRLHQHQGVGGPGGSPHHDPAGHGRH
jgi:hypothetical protein